MTDNFPNLDFELSLSSSGEYDFIIGFDEVGRGALAGPVYVAAVLLDMRMPQNLEIPEGLRDSKLIREKDRPIVCHSTEIAFPIYGISGRPASEIDREGITNSLNLAAMASLEEVLSKATSENTAVTPSNAALLLDGSHDWLSPTLPEWDVYTRVKGDKECVSMAAASIIAKVRRDTYMVELAQEESLSVYGWESNKGYGSKKHQEAIGEFGPTSEHRATWIQRFITE